MNFKGLKRIHVTIAVMAGLVFLGEAAADSGNIRRTARQISVTSSKIYRIAERQASRFDYREESALRDLRNLQDSAQNFEMDVDGRRTRRSLDGLDQAAQRASNSLNDLTAHHRIENDMRNIKLDIQQVRRALGQGGNGYGRGINVAPLARSYKRQIQSVIDDIKYLTVRSRDRDGWQTPDRGRGHRRGNGNGRRPRVRAALQSLRILKQEANAFLQLARTQIRPRRLMRAFEGLAASHRLTRQEVNGVLRRSGSMASMREASRTLRELGQKMTNRRGGNGGGFDDNFSSFEDDFGFGSRH